MAYIVLALEVPRGRWQRKIISKMNGKINISKKYNNFLLNLSEMNRDIWAQKPETLKDL